MGNIGMVNGPVRVRFVCAEGHVWAGEYETAGEFYRGSGVEDTRAVCSVCGGGVGRWVSAKVSGLVGERG